MRGSVLAVVVIVLAGCAEKPAEMSPAIEVLGDAAGDTSGALPLDAVLADAAKEQLIGGKVTGLARPEAWIVRVLPAEAGEVEPPLPDAPLSAPPDDDLRPRLVADPGLKPPILRQPARIVIGPGRAPAPPAFVVLEVLVDADGEVLDAVWTDGTSDSSLIVQARECALGMRFFPALLNGHPVKVWCRQRFEFSLP